MKANVFLSFSFCVVGLSGLAQDRSFDLSNVHDPNKECWENFFSSSEMTVSQLQHIYNLLFGEIYQRANDCQREVIEDVKIGLVAELNCGHDQQSKAGVKIYPNPTDNKLFLTNLSLTGIYHISILTIQGKLVLEKQFIWSEKEASPFIETGSLPSGIYYLNLTGNAIHKTIYFLKK